MQPTTMPGDVSVEGVVVSVDRRARKIVVSTEGRTTTVLCTGIEDFPDTYFDKILENTCVDDLFYGTVDSNGCLVEDPFITTRVDKHDVVMWAAIRVVRFNGKLLVQPPTLEAILECARTQEVEGDLGEQLSRIASEFNLGVRSVRAQHFMTSYTKPPCNGKYPLNVDDVVRFFKLWNFKNDMRLLYLLGLDGDQIAQMYMKPCDLYRRVLEDPISVHSIPQALALHIAKITGHPPYSKDELRAGTLLRELAQSTYVSGNMYVHSKRFFQRHKVTDAQYKLLLKYAMMMPMVGTQEVPIDPHNKRLYIKELYDIEHAVAERLAIFMMEKYDPIPLAINPDDAHLKEDVQQNKAIHMALTCPVCVITGPAGTGKTTIVKRILYCLSTAGIKVCCTSFTGQATDRIETSSGFECANMDSMIALRENYQFDYLIIDESSMVNIDLMYRFLSAFPGPYRLLLIGDVKQLPPIGPGRVLEQLIISETIPVTVLSTIHRVASSLSKIVENSQRIASWGNTERFEFKTGPEFEVVQGDEETIVDEIYRLQADGYGLEDFAIITPFKDHLAGLGRVIQMAYNKNSPFIVKEPKGWKVYPRLTKELVDQIDSYKEVRAYHIGDRVIVRGRVKEHNIYNGQEGVVTGVSASGVTVSVIKKGQPTPILFPLRGGKEDPDETGVSESKCSVYMLDLANALTVHRIQGGQRRRVIVWIDAYKKKAHKQFVCKEIIYTAITRASESVLIVHRGSAAEEAVTNIITDRRDTLAESLIGILPRDYMLERDTLMEAEVAARKEAVIQECIKEFGDADDGDCCDDFDW